MDAFAIIPENHFIPIISNLPAIGRVLCANRASLAAVWLILADEKGLRRRKDYKKRERKETEREKGRMKEKNERHEEVSRIQIG